MTTTSTSGPGAVRTGPPAVRAAPGFGEVRLLQIGGEWTAEQRAQIERLGLGPAVRQVRGLTRTQVAPAYRVAAVVLQPSEAEGFGLPVAEAYDVAVAAMVDNMLADDAKEGIGAFLGKRMPEWGRK